MTEQRKAEDIRKEITSSDMEEMAKALERLDENSKVLAKTYLSALMDRQNMGKAKPAQDRPA